MPPPLWPRSLLPSTFCMTAPLTACAAGPGPSPAAVECDRFFFFLSFLSAAPSGTPFASACDSAALGSFAAAVRPGGLLCWARVGSPPLTDACAAAAPSTSSELEPCSASGPLLLAFPLPAAGVLVTAATARLGAAAPCRRRSVPGSAAGGPPACAAARASALLLFFLSAGAAAMPGPSSAPLGKRAAAGTAALSWPASPAACAPAAFCAAASGCP